MHELVNKYVDVLTKLGKFVALGIKHKIHLLELEKRISHHKQQKISEREL